MDVGRTDDVEPRCERLPLETALADDFTEAASDLSPLGETRVVLDARGLSPLLLEPGIRVLRFLNDDFAESLVSEREKDGYESSSGPSPVGVRVPLLRLSDLDG